MIPNNERLIQIKERWNPSDNLGIAHPIIESELMEDIEFLFQTLDKCHTYASKTRERWLKSSPREIKVKKGVPTVIEYQGRRYVLDASNRK